MKARDHNIHFRIGVTGTRTPLSPEQEATLRSLLEAWFAIAQRNELSGRVIELHHGDCMGADATAHHIAQELGLSIIIHPPIDRRYRARCEGAVQVLPCREYLERNRTIVDQADTLIACPRGRQEVQRSGTWATVRYARRRGIPVTFVFPDGLVKPDDKE